MLASATARAGDAFRRGYEAYRAGKLEEAAKLFEDEDDRDDVLARRFNAGVSWLEAGVVDKALQRFEEVSARAEGTLRDDALYNAGSARFRQSKALVEEARKIEDPDQKLRKLADAAKAYRATGDFFRQVREKGADVERNLAVTKTALRAVLDEMARIEAEKRKKAEDEALKSPPELLRALVEKERVHRALARSVAAERGARARIAARRLRKSTEETRQLAEKLRHHLEVQAKEPSQDPGAKPDPAAQGQPPAPSEEERKRLGEAAEAVGRAIEAQQAAEIAYGRLQVAEAPAHHTRAMRELRKARELLPLDIAVVIQDALGLQERVHGAIAELAPPEAEGAEKEKPKAPGVAGAIAGAIVDAIQDKVLQPIAKLMDPSRAVQSKALGDEEEDVIWGSGLLARAEIPPSPAPPAGGPGPAGLVPGGPAPGGPQPGGAPPGPASGGLDAEAAKALSEALRKEGQTALDAASKAAAELSAGRPEPALAPAADALAALRRAADLLPKPPEPPEERLRKLIQKERDTREAVEGLQTLSEDLQDTARIQIATNQRAAGKEAGGIAAELEARQDEPARKAAPKVREGEGKVYSSGEALARDLRVPAKESIDQAIRAFEEALALLSGEQDPQQPKEQPQEQEKQQPGQDEEKDREEQKKEQSQYALTPLEARAIQEEMDRKRRAEEAKIFVPSAGTVEKDW